MSIGGRKFQVWDLKCLDKLLNELYFNLHLEEALVFESENEIYM